MIQYLIIGGKTSTALIIFYLFYRYLLAKDKQFIRNRVYLAGSSILSFILPWIHIPVYSTSVTSLPITIAYIAEGNRVTGVENVSENYGIPWIQIIVGVYLIGMIFFIIKSLISYFQVYTIIKNAFHIPYGSLKMAITQKKVSPFSFLNWMVVSKETQQHPSFEKMVQHEMIHSRQYHSVDLFIAEMLVFLQWFNPFAWLIRKSIMENLEFLVDKEMLDRGVDAREYQYSLLSFSMVGIKSAVANNFNTNLLKKRIAMMNTNNSPRKYRLNNFLIPVCLIFALLLTASFQKQTKVISTNGLNPNLTEKAVRSYNNVVDVNKPKAAAMPRVDSENKFLVDQSPIVPEERGEEIFLGFITKNILYPKNARENNVKGTVKLLVSFKTGYVEVQEKNQGEISGVNEMKEVVVLGYAPKHLSIRTVESGKSSESELKNEVERVVKTFSNVPKDLIGKTYVLTVKFILDSGFPADSPTVTGYTDNKKGKINPNVIIIEEADGSNAGEEPVFILNDEKIITKTEMEKILPENIESIEIVKAKKLDHKKVGTINGSVIIITEKK